MRFAVTRPTAEPHRRVVGHGGPRPAYVTATRALGMVLACSLAACASASGDGAPTAAATTAPATTSTSAAVTSTRPASPTTGSATSAPPATSGPTSTSPATTGPPVPAAPTAAATSPAATSPAAPTTVVPPPMLADLATDPAGLAAQLTVALRTILDPAATPAQIEAAGRRQQLVYRRLAARAEWQEATLAAVPDDLRPFAANDVTAINAPGDAALARPIRPLERLPAWTIRAPRPADELVGYYREGEAATGIPWTYLAAINLVETKMGRIIGLSSASAIGPMQFLRSTWDACCEGDPTVDRDAIIGAATYLRRRGGPADMRRAILGYNPNDAYLVMVDRYATNLAAQPGLYRGYHAWEVFVSTTAGPLRLPTGFSAPEPVPAADYWTAHPEDRA